MTPGAGGGPVDTTLPLALSIVATLCCWGGLISLPLGIIGIVFSIQAINLQKIGDIEQARNKAKTATIMAGVAMGLGIIGSILSWILGFAGAVMNN